MTIDITDEQAAILLKVTNSSTLEDAVLTAINGRLHLMGVDVTPPASGTPTPLEPLSESEFADLVSSTREGLERELAKAGH